jgi:hypothetical protein
MTLNSPDSFNEQIFRANMMSTKQIEFLKWAVARIAIVLIGAVLVALEFPLADFRAFSAILWMAIHSAVLFWECEEPLRLHVCLLEIILTTMIAANVIRMAGGPPLMTMALFAYAAFRFESEFHRLISSFRALGDPDTNRNDLPENVIPM